MSLTAISIFNLELSSKETSEHLTLKKSCNPIIMRIEVQTINSRVYDPTIGQFLSPDNYVQLPDASLGFNRYSYALNNPLVFTDPSGELFGLVKWTFIKEGAKALVKTAESWGRELFLEGGLDVTSRKHRRQAWADMDPTADTYSGRAWSDFDPTKPGTQTNNALRIEAGLFMHTPGWETPQSVMGNVSAHARNITGNVTNVEVGLNYVLVNNRDADRWGFTLGTYINSGGIVEDYKHDPLFIHEFGHTVQSKILGPSYFFKVGVPSAMSAFFDYDTQIEHNHDRTWFEINANQFGQIFYEPDYTISASGTNDYPTNFSEIDWWFLLFNPYIF